MERERSWEWRERERSWEWREKETAVQLYEDRTDLEEVGQHSLVEALDSLGAEDGGNGVGCPTVGEAVAHSALHLHAPADHIQGVADCTHGRCNMSSTQPWEVSGAGNLLDWAVAPEMAPQLSFQRTGSSLSTTTCSLWSSSLRRRDNTWPGGGGGDDTEQRSLVPSPLPPRPLSGWEGTTLSNVALYPAPSHPDHFRGGRERH